MMNYHGVTILFIICCIWNIAILHAQNNNFIINDFGGVSGGKIDNKRALENAWKKACETPGGTILIPKGSFLVSNGDFKGPCKGLTRFRIDGTLLASSGFGDNQDSWLSFKKVDGLTFFGTGTLDGNGASTWSRCKASKNCGNRPTTLKITYVTNALIQGIHLVNSKMFHLNIYESQNVNVKNVHISAPKDSPNTDGIHIAHSDYVNIMDSFIGTGDDCVSIGDGSRKVSVSGVLCGPGHGISIGSLGLYKGEKDVSGITVRNCSLTKTQNGLRIKTWAPSKSPLVVSDITFAHINLNSVGNPIIIDQYYCPSGSCEHKGESSVEVRGVKYVGVRGSSSISTAVNIQCSKSKPCQDIDLAGVQITYNGQPTTAICSTCDVKFQGSAQIPSRCP